MRIINKILYFILTVIVLGSTGVTIPVAIDYFQHSDITNQSLVVLPYSLLTYYLSLFFIAIVDRILIITKDTTYTHKITEILIIGIVTLLIIGLLTFFSFKSLMQNNYSSATFYASLGTITAFVIWWIANYKDTKVDPFNSLGGEINNR